MAYDEFLITRAQNTSKKLLANCKTESEKREEIKHAKRMYSLFFFVATTAGLSDGEAKVNKASKKNNTEEAKRLVEKCC